MEKQDIYVAINIEKREGSDPEFFVIGTYATHQGAVVALERQFVDDISMYDESDLQGNSRTKLDNKLEGSFRYEIDGDNNYFEYIIERKTLEK